MSIAGSLGVFFMPKRQKTTSNLEEKDLTFLKKDLTFTENFKSFPKNCLKFPKKDLIINTEASKRTKRILVNYCRWQR